MRSASVVLGLAMVMAAAFTFLPLEARALDPPKLILTVEGGVGDQNLFNPVTIVVPSVPIILNITLINNGTVDMPHTFSIRERGVQDPRIEVTTLHPGDRSSIEFAVNSSTQIYYGGELFTAESSTAGGIKFFCRPHEAIGMVGNIVVGGVAPREQPEIGVFLRAYWIGIIGLVAMLVWIGITYFIIKASSRHSQDHREHIRRGLT